MPNPNIEAIRQMVAASGLDAGTIPEQRQAMEATAGMQRLPDGVTVETTTVAGRPAEWIAPDTDANQSVVIYLHGGAYCIGSLSTHRNLVSRLALAYGGRVLNLDYRLAPEDPHPAAIDDVVAAYCELLDHGLDPSDMALAGDSAGGGLTVAALLAIRDAALPMPAAAVCLSPWADLTQSASTFDTRAEADPMVTKAMLDEMADAYLAGRPATDPLASPALGDLTGLPPLLVQVGDAEVLLDDSIRLRDAALAAGVEVTLDVWPDMIHVFQAFPPELLPESDQSLTKVGAFLAAHLT